MTRKSVVLIKTKRKKMSNRKRDCIRAFFRTLFCVGIVLGCVISVIYFCAVAESRTRMIGFGVKENSVDIKQQGDEFIYRFFSITDSFRAEALTSALAKMREFLLCFLSPAVRIACSLLVILPI